MRGNLSLGPRGALAGGPEHVSEAERSGAHAGDGVGGPVGELVLYVYGRKDVAAVELDGPADAVARVGAASFGF